MTAARPQEAEIAGVGEGDYSQRPFILIWEVTQACVLACVHCRAEARPRRDPRELTTEEGFRLIDQIRELSPPLFVITGGDPLMRPDLFELMRYATEAGLRVSFSPSGTRFLTREAMRRSAEAGVVRVALSLDGSNAEVHDSFRRVRGSYKWTMEGIEHCRGAGLSLQVNTTVTRRNLGDLPAMAERVEELGAVLWSAFFLVTVGRAQEEDQITGEQFEEVFHFLYDVSKTAPYRVKTTEAHHYRRVVLQRRKAEGLSTAGGWREAAGGYFEDGLNFSRRGIYDGDGFCFVSHVGEVYPSGFFPLSGGNVRERSVGDIYRASPLFLELRDRGNLKGKCGICEFKHVCGGSRSRAYAATGDYLAEEPCCIYQPRR